MSLAGTFRDNSAGNSWCECAAIGGGSGGGGIVVRSNCNQCPPGLPGASGTPAALWFTGAGPPLATIGSTNRSLYLDTVTGNVYQRINDMWVLVGNISGLAGDIGNPGSPGLAGPNIQNLTIASNSGVFSVITLGPVFTAGTFINLNSSGNNVSLTVVPLIPLTDIDVLLRMFNMTTDGTFTRLIGNTLPLVAPTLDATSTLQVFIFYSPPLAPPNNLNFVLIPGAPFIIPLPMGFTLGDIVDFDIIVDHDYENMGKYLFFVQLGNTGLPTASEFNGSFSATARLEDQT